MPQLLNSNIVELTCPSPDPDDPIVVTMDLTPYGGIYEDVYDNRNVRIASGPLAAAILDWNLTDAGGEPEPITAENIRRLPQVTLQFLATKLFDTLDIAVEAKPVSAEEKKA
ncbi:hypothetical protein HWD35_10300 [Tsukamurella tyrosinosolvens]|uniref:hypothetical protein n=1 Tax=Tsukamurella tyrosinosolvens TaxID=57704 RepID=UPI001CE21E1D|nr:hypothetical protein [Tsukamurella tyrosinosolvens]MCA4995102.1 hypothetical protein [Tsukamurella tyrosinosolvens]